MKKIKLLALAITLCLLGCSNNPDEPLLENSENSETFSEKLIKEYNINKQGLNIESVTNGIDTSHIFLNGRINGHLWIGEYEKKSKKQILDWIENSELDTIVNYYKGYGEYGTFNVKKFALDYPYENNNAFCFLLWGRDNVSGMNKNVSSDLYFIQNSSTIKKYRTIYSSQNSLKYYQKITPWHQGVVVEKAYEEHVCFNMQGDSLFTINSVFGIKDSYSPINYEECIDFSTSTTTKDLRKSFFQRIDLKNNQSIWINPMLPLSDIPNNVRFENYTIEKLANEWTYIVNYTLYDGSKKTTLIKLNIGNGNFVVK